MGRVLEPCHLASDCAERQVCRIDGYCGCDFEYGFTNSPECNEYTSKTTLSFALSVLLLLTALLAVAVCLITTRNVLRVRPKGFFLSCSILCLLAAGTGMPQDIIYMVYYLTARNNRPYHAELRSNISLAIFFIHGSLFISAVFNLGLMWIEFVSASRRAEQVGSNLRRTATFLYVFILLWLLSSVGLLVLSRMVNAIFYQVWQLSTAFSLVVSTVAYVSGGRAMRGIFLKSAQRSTQDGAMVLTASPSASANEFRKAQLMRVRARTTQRSYLVVGWCAVTYVCMSVVWALLRTSETSHTAVWISTSFLRCSLYVCLCAMCYWLYICVSIEASSMDSGVEDHRSAPIRVFIMGGVVAPGQPLTVGSKDTGRRTAAQGALASRTEPMARMSAPSAETAQLNSTESIQPQSIETAQPQSKRFAKLRSQRAKQPSRPAPRNAACSPRSESILARCASIVPTRPVPACAVHPSEEVRVCIACGIVCAPTSRSAPTDSRPVQQGGELYCV